MKILKITLGLFLAVCIVFSLMTPAFALKEERATDYPFVLVHGINGWGENTYDKDRPLYWGLEGDYDIAAELRAKGFRVAVPSVGTISSAWDRACELFAQLTGTVVDYGAAHSEKYGHSRYGRDYTGKAMLDEDWYISGKANFITHSFGGATVRILSSLLAYGNEAEKAASPDDCSPLFRGGYDSCVYSITTLQSPNNGTPVVNILNDTGLLYPVVFICHLIGLGKEPSIDFMLDQFGITADPSEGGKASFNPKGVINFVRSGDNCAYDMTLQGARKINEDYKMNDKTFYFSFSASEMKKGVGTLVVPAEFSLYAVLGLITAGLAGETYGGISTDRSWAYNDGIVPVPSALYPEGQLHEDYKENITPEPGVWYVMPTSFGGHSHGTIGDDVEEFWKNLTDILDTAVTIS